MRSVLIVGDFCYPNYAGGSSKHVFDLMKGLSPSVKLELLTRRRERNNKYCVNDSDAEISFNKWKSEGRIFELTKFHLFNPIVYYKHIRGKDFVLIQHPVMGVLAAFWSAILGVPAIYHYHGPLHKEYHLKSSRRGLRYVMLWALQKLTCSLSKKVIFHSNYMADVAVKEHNIHFSKRDFLPPYIELKPDKKAVPIDGIDLNKKNILIPRRLTARTGVLEFLEHFCAMEHDLQKMINVIVTGTGELSQSVSELAERNSSITYLGFVTYEKLWDLYRNVDAVVVPSIALEGFGYVILEALSCGASIVVSKTCGGGYDFVVDNVGENATFDIYSRLSVESMLRALCTTAVCREDNIMLAKKFSFDKMVERYLKHFLVSGT